MAKTGLEGAHRAMFLAGDAETLLRTESVESLVGIGTGLVGARCRHQGVPQPRSPLRESAKARGVTHDQLSLDNAPPAQPARLLELAAAADFVLSY